MTWGVGDVVLFYTLMATKYPLYTFIASLVPFSAIGTLGGYEDLYVKVNLEPLKWVIMGPTLLLWIVI